MATRTDLVQLGNTIDAGASAAAGSLTISAGASSTNGLAKGDTIRIAGEGDYVIDKITTTGDITLTNGLEKIMSTGADVALISTVDEDLSAISAPTTDVITSLAVSDFNGYAVGDKITLTNSEGASVTTTINAIAQSTGTLSVASVTLTLADVTTTFSQNTRAVVGSSFTASDYVKYDVEGMTLTGVQLTNSDAEGVANTGLGRVADLINESTSVTGIKAVATVKANSLIGVTGGTLGSDMKINGVTVMESGQSVQTGDSDNAIVSAINEKTDLTGVTASLEADGTLTLSSDGRAMKLEGFTLSTGINDGTVAGSLSLTKNGLEVMDVTSSHFSDAGLTTAAGAAAGTRAAGLTEIVDNHTLSELVTGQKDSNGDGSVDNDDAVGLLMTREGAMLAMDITEAAIGQLDAIRADLGSSQNQLTVTVNNISVTQVNVKAAESNIRDVDFAAESAALSLTF